MMRVWIERACYLALTLIGIAALLSGLWSLAH